MGGTRACAGLAHRNCGRTVNGQELAYKRVDLVVSDTFGLDTAKALLAEIGYPVAN